MIKSLLFLFVFLFFGEAISGFFKLLIPGNVIGMILIFLSLKMKFISLESVKPAADLLIKNLGFFFIVPGVGLMLYFDLIKAHWLPLSLAITISAFLTMAVTGLIQQKLEKE